MLVGVGTSGWWDGATTPTLAPRAGEAVVIAVRPSPQCKSPLDAYPQPAPPHLRRRLAALPLGPPASHLSLVRPKIQVLLHPFGRRALPPVPVPIPVPLAVAVALPLLHVPQDPGLAGGTPCTCSRLHCR